SSPLTLGLPFDFEGTPKRRVDIIEEGVFRTGVHDRRSAKKAGVESTGHALPPPNPEGPFPLNLFLGTGDASLEDMISSTRREPWERRAADPSSTWDVAPEGWAGCLPASGA